MLRRLNLPRGSRAALRDEMESMVAQGVLRRAGNRRYVRVSASNTKVGTLTLTRQGYGFVALENSAEQGDVYISGRALRGAMHRDRVEINIFESRAGKVEGEVIRVLERGTHTFVGFVHQARKAQWITPRDERLPDRIRLNGDAVHGQLVAARFVSWPGSGAPVAEAEVLRVFAGMDSGEQKSSFTISGYRWSSVTLHSRRPTPCQPTPQTSSRTRDAKT